MRRSAHEILALLFLCSLRLTTTKSSGMCEKGYKYECHKTTVCVDTADSFNCECKEGYAIINNGNGWTECEKVAKEEVPTTAVPDVCDQKCTKEHERCEGSGQGYKCKCAEGYSHQGDGESRICVAAETTTTEAPGENFC